MKIFKKKEPSELDKVIAEQIKNLGDDDNLSETEKIENLKKLTDIKTELEGQKYSINPNVVLSGVVTLAGIVMVIIHERDGVITSKALGFIPKIFKN